MKILIILMLIFFASCKKEKKICYSCQTYESGQLEYITKCGGDGHYQDANGNNLQCIQIP